MLYYFILIFNNTGSIEMTIILKISIKNSCDCRKTLMGKDNLKNLITRMKYFNWLKLNFLR